MNARSHELGDTDTAFHGPGRWSNARWRAAQINAMVDNALDDLDAGRLSITEALRTIAAIAWESGIDEAHSDPG